LIGEGLIKEDIQTIEHILEEEPNITTYQRPLSLYFGPNEVLINLNVKFKNQLTAKQIEQTIDRMEAAIKKAIPTVNRIFIEAETIKEVAQTSIG